MKLKTFAAFRPATTGSAAPQLGAEKAAGSFLAPLMSGRDRLVFAILIALWLAALAQFWVWWLQPAHNIGVVRYVLNTVLVAWTTLLPAYFLAILAMARITDPTLSIPTDWRVAMVVTKAPSEPEAVVQQTLLSMLAQGYPHDTWLADEDPTPAMAAWCERHGVKISTRKGVADYHRPTWPRRTMCKEGNLTYFYDNYGYGSYDFVAQLDADHVPTDGYLEAMLRPFIDPAVGYVSAPSQCDANAENSWSARGRLHVEAPLHGALQAGYNGGLAPLCIGSHYAVRTSALRAVGGLGPELAEDHSTTLLMNAGGWRGVHALDAHAHGDGPNTFADMAVQEFQWSRSLMKILLQYTHRYIGQLPWRLKLQFLFGQLWYTLFSLTMLATVALPIVALTSGKAWVGIAYAEFFVRMAFVTAAVLAVVFWVSRRGWCRPHTHVVSWEGLLFLFARWPWNLMGVAVAIAERVTGRESEFKVTPKGNRAAGPLPFRVIAVYLGLSAASAATAVAVPGAGTAQGFYAFSIVNAVIYLAVAVTIAKLHAKENGIGELREPGKVFRLQALGRSTAVGAVSALLLVSTVLRLPAGIDGILWGTGLALTTRPVIAEQMANAGTLAFGVYDPSRAFDDAAYVGMEHHFISWLEADYPKRLRQLAGYARERDRWPVVSIEPWSDGREGSATLLEGVRQGLYDDVIHRACSELAAMDMPLFVRFGHEMEVPTGRYPWADPDSNAFIAAYRRFVDACRSQEREFYYVWSPRGDGPHHKYYPGADYVDHVGLSLYSYAAYEIDHYGHLRSFGDNLADRYDGASFYGKPIIIAELGVDGPSEHRWQWLTDGMAELEHFPLLHSIVYFNAPDHPEAWGPDWPVPDWSIDPSMFTKDAVD